VSRGDIIFIADGAYPDGLISMYASDPHGDHGDELAKFIVLELDDTVSKNMPLEIQLHEAINAMERVREEISAVIDAFDKALVEERRKR
jgi:L-fucose mutarotase/ribose pyranase (RbsD/FucU family)